ncbi:MAG: HU family DNA-binding protein [Anaerolineae bacterium]|nr:HU family DNA-binding protein [Thermoflexales bacterium]MDW8407342.1 HU family DNA-binding protein [Anaerolineae bacterium]
MAEKKLTNAQFVSEIAQKSGLSKKDVSAALSTLNAIVIEQLGKGGPGEVTILGLLKLNTVEKPATSERQGINRFTGQPTIFKAKPASRTVRARPVKALKDAV